MSMMYVRKSLCALLVLAVFPCVGFAKSANQDSSDESEDSISTQPLTSSTKKTSVYLELLGRNVLYSVGIEQPLTSRTTIGLAGSYVSRSESYYKWTVTMLNPYITFYSGERNRLLATAGLLLGYGTNEYHSNEYTLNSNGDYVQTSDGVQHYSGLEYVPQAGGGYEFRGTGGFIFRLTAYAMYLHSSAAISAQILPFLGLTLGSTL